MTLSRFAVAGYIAWPGCPSPKVTVEVRSLAFGALGMTEFGMVPILSN